MTDQPKPMTPEEIDEVEKRAEKSGTTSEWLHIAVDDVPRLIATVRAFEEREYARRKAKDTQHAFLVAQDKQIAALKAERDELRERWAALRAWAMRLDGCWRGGGYADAILVKMDRLEKGDGKASCE